MQIKDDKLSENSRKTRDHAETMFSKTQTQMLSLGRIMSEQDAASQAREAKTARLREMRLEKQAEEEAAAKIAKAAGPVKRGAKR